MFKTSYFPMTKKKSQFLAKWHEISQFLGYGSYSQNGERKPWNGCMIHDRRSTICHKHLWHTKNSLHFYRKCSLRSANQCISVVRMTTSVLLVYLSSFRFSNYCLCCYWNNNNKCRILNFTENMEFRAFSSPFWEYDL
jgi:hypothetical protein